MCEHGGLHRPAHARAWSDVLLEIVGVQLDQARQQIVTSAIGGAGGAKRTRSELNDQSVSYDDAALDDGVGRDDSGICEDQFFAHQALSACGSSKMRVPRASRTSTS